MSIRSRTMVVALVSALAGAPACGPSQAQVVRPSSPFTPAMAHLFDDAVDYVEDASGLGGRVAREWSSQIDGLSQNSDLIASVTIETVVQGTDADGSRSYRLVARVQDAIRGMAPEDGRVPLRVSQGQTGFTTVLGKEARLQSSRYVLFAKWYTDATNTVRAHWHLSPLSDSLVARVRRSSGVEAQERGTERVVSQEGAQTPVIESSSGGAAGGGADAGAP
jgi:hypothetical protein